MNEELGERFYLVPLVESGVKIFECYRGHKIALVTSPFKFETLVEISLQALVDGYYRDAVVSIAAALERTYEYYVRVIAESEGQTQQAFEDTFPPRSEPQRGMFIGVYWLKQKSTPPMLHNSAEKFRNDVVHGGHVPSLEEARSHIRKTLDVIRPILSTVRCSFADDVERLGNKVGREIAETLPKGLDVVAGVGFGASLYLLLDPPQGWTLEHAEAAQRQALAQALQLGATRV